MKSNILINNIPLGEFDGYDKETNTITFQNISDQTYHFVFEDTSLDDLKIVLIHSDMTIIENYKGKISSCHFEISLDESSKLKRFSIMVNNTADLKVLRDVHNKGDYQSMQLDLNECDIDSTENINLDAEGSNALVIDGIYAVKENNKKYQTNLNHYASNGKSSAQIFAINNDDAKVSIFTDAYIKNGAHGTNTTQEGRIINLTDTCYGIVLPNLHIDENDVEASHSCSVGSVNQDHMYYLETRGLSELQARNILIRGYFNPIVNNIEDEAIKNEINTVLDQRIG